MSKLKIGLALGGGGALGMAHIGALKALDENGINPDVVVGTSIGALVGGVYASGISIAEMEEIVLKIKTKHILDINLTFSGMIKGRSATRLIKKALGKDFLIEDLPKEFKAIAVNVKEGKQVVFDCGSLIDAIRSSISIPGVFVPHKIKGEYLVDGCVLNNLPEDVTREFSDVVISVDLLSDFTPYTYPKTWVHSLAFGWLIMLKELVKLKKNYADVRINPPLKNFRQHRFNKKCTKEMIEIGYNETIKLMPQIKKAIKKAEKEFEAKSKTKANKTANKKTSGNKKLETNLSAVNKKSDVNATIVNEKLQNAITETNK